MWLRLVVFGAHAGVVEVRAEVAEAGLVVAEEMPNDHQDGSTDRDDGFLLASSSSDSSVAFAEEGVGPSGAGGRFTEDPGEVAVAVPGGPVSFAAAGGFLDPGREPGPRAQVRRGREPGHVNPDLGENDAGGLMPDTRDLIQSCHRLSERGDFGLDRGVEVVEVGADLVNPGEHLGQQEGMVVVEPAGERLFQLGQLAAQPSTRVLGKDLRVSLGGVRSFV